MCPLVHYSEKKFSQIHRNNATLLICVLICLFLITGCKSVTNVQGDLKSFGLQYQLKELNEPRPNRVHVLHVDLTNNKIKPVVIIAEDPDGEGPADAALTDPRKLACDPSVLAFININPWDSFPDVAGKKNHRWFEGQPVDILGLVASNGQIRSSALPNNASLWFTGNGCLSLGEATENTPITEGMAGFQQIVKEGTISVPQGGAVHPRTAIGLDQRGTVMYLVIVDGRQAQYSEGMDLYELASLMLELGCWNATNMDGGGSSIMGLAEPGGQLCIMNSPSGRGANGTPKIRPVPTILTIQRK